MPDRVVQDFPIFALDLVALPSEVVPLHIFEERYRAMMAEVLDDDGEFGIVWTAPDGLREIGCAMEITSVLERLEDGRLNILTAGTRPFRIIELGPELPYPTATVEFLQDAGESVDDDALQTARDVYAELVEEATDKEPEPERLAAMDAYAMAATVDFGAEAKQQLLDLRSEAARLRLVTRLIRAAVKRLEFVERALTRARSNGKVRFG
jgi:Lon protease-like protein